MLDGILDMMGPKTLDGGYSPSQYMSSAMLKAVDSLVTKAVEGKATRACDEAGTNACETARTRATIKKESLDMIIDCDFCVVKTSDYVEATIKESGE
jgi:hypothetical protein